MPVNYRNLELIQSFCKEKDHNTQLMCVTKNRSLREIQELYDFGIRIFGENKVQEAKSKFLDSILSKIELHLIGPLQTNKVKNALQLFDIIQSLDRTKLIDEIVKVQKKISVKTHSYFIQVNIGEEDQKSGVLPIDLKDLYDYAINSGLKIKGLMCIPPADLDPKIFFQKMLIIKNNLNSNLKLSMGMSQDYNLAMKYETNLIRVGSKIFE